MQRLIWLIFLALLLISACQPIQPATMVTLSPLDSGGSSSKISEPEPKETTNVKLMPETPEAVAILQETTDTALGVTELVLANGVRLLLKPTTFAQSEVAFMATSPGGTSLVADKDFDSLWIINNVVNRSGVGAFTNEELHALLTSHNMLVQPWISTLNEGIAGSTSTQDLEIFFQLLYLYFTQPRADADVLITVQNELQNWISMQKQQPEAAWQNALQEITCGQALRCQQLTLERLETTDLAHGFALYQERFADANDFTFIFVGSFELAQIKPLAQRYLGALPTLPTVESWRDVSLPPPTGIYTRTFYTGLMSQSNVQTSWEAAVTKAGPVESVNMEALHNIVEQRLRKELGDIYNLYLAGTVTRYPKPHSQFFLEITCTPERADQVATIVLTEIQKLQAIGPTAEELTQFKAQAKHSHEEELKQNGSWHLWLLHYAQTPDESMTDILTYAERIDSVTAATVQRAAQQYLSLGNYIQLIRYPEGYRQP